MGFRVQCMVGIKQEVLVIGVDFLRLGFEGYLGGFEVWGLVKGQRFEDI